jgi:hypothetical protein
MNFIYRTGIVLMLTLKITINYTAELNLILLTQPKGSIMID